MSEVGQVVEWNIKQLDFSGKEIINTTEVDFCIYDLIEIHCKVDKFLYLVITATHRESNAFQNT